jgi:hypothetical protein
MTKWLVITAIVLLAVTAGLLVWRNSRPDAAARSVILVITGPEGQKFTGSYSADGKTNLLNGVVPMTIAVRATELTYGFQPEDRRDEFQVALEVENLNRTSVATYKGGTAKGGWRCWNGGECAW